MRPPPPAQQLRRRPRLQHSRLLQRNRQVPSEPALLWAGKGHSKSRKFLQLLPALRRPANLCPRSPRRSLYPRLLPHSHNQTLQGYRTSLRSNLELSPKLLPFLRLKHLVSEQCLSHLQQRPPSRPHSFPKRTAARPVRSAPPPRLPRPPPQRLQTSSAPSRPRNSPRGAGARRPRPTRAARSRG